MTDAAPALSGRRGAPAVTVVGVVLVILYIICVLSVVVSFSAYVLRTDWSGVIAIDDSDVRDLDYLIYLVRQDENLTSQIHALQKEIVDANERMDQTSTRLEVLRFNLADSQAELAALQAQPTGAEVKVFANLEGSSTVPQEETGSADAEEPVSRLADIKKRQGEITAARTNIRAAEADLVRWKENRDHFLSEQKEERTALDDLRETLPMASVHRGRWNALSDAGWFNPMALLVPLPTILLTLIATIAAGALGSLVGYTRSVFQAGERLSCAGLLIIVGEGIAAAIGVFLFAGAGMLVLSQGGGPDGRLELSPFTVAFLAFLSGFMAEAAFTKITRFGRDLFEDSEEQQTSGTGQAQASPTVPAGTPEATQPT